MTQEASTPTETAPVVTPPVAPIVPPVEPQVPVTPPVEPQAPEVPAVPPLVPPTETPTEVTPPVETPAEPPKPTAERSETSERVVPTDAAGYTLPEGVPVAMAEFAKQHDFTQGQLDASLQQFGSIIQASKTSEMATMRAAGEAHIKAMGTEGEHNMGLAKRALKQLDSAGKMTELLQTSGFGNHPTVIDFLHSIGNSLKEGGFLKSAANIPIKGKTAAERMYPNMNTNNQ